MSLLRRRTAGRSCNLHGDNGCEIQGEAGPRERPQDTRAWRTDIEEELADDEAGRDHAVLEERVAELGPST